MPRLRAEHHRQACLFAVESVQLAAMTRIYLDNLNLGDCEDIEQTYAELSERGVGFTAPPVQMHFGWWSMFEDWEGTRFALGQWTSGSG